MKTRLTLVLSTVRVSAVAVDWATAAANCGAGMTGIGIGWFDRLLPLAGVWCSIKPAALE